MNLSFQRLLLVVPFVLVVLAKQSGADTQLAQSSVAVSQIHPFLFLSHFWYHTLGSDIVSLH